MSPSSSPRRSGGRLAALGRLLLGILLVTWFGAGVGYLVLRHVLWPRVDEWRPQLVERLSQELGRPVSVGRIETGFDGLLPRITLEDIAVRGPDGGDAASAASVTAVVSLRTLLSAQFRLALLRVERPLIRIERIAPGRLRIAGFEVDLDAPPEPALVDQWLRQRRIVVSDARIEWEDAVRGVQRRFEGLELSSTGAGRRHRVSLRAADADGLWRGLELSGDLERPPGMGPPRPLRAEAYLGTEGLDFAGVSAVLPWPDALPRAGLGDLRVWVDVAEGRLRSAQTSVTASALLWPEAGGGWRIDTVSAEATIEPVGEIHEVRVQRLSAALPGGLAMNAVGEQMLRFDVAGRPVSGRVALDRFDAAAALAFARSLPVSLRPPGRLEAVQMAGTISGLTARWSLGSGSQAEATDYDVSVDFGDLALRQAPGAHWPWFEGLTGQARITPASGEVRLRAGPATLGFPGVFPDPVIALDTLAGEARWTRGRTAGGSALQLQIAELRFANADAEGLLRGSYRSGGRGAGIVDLTGRLSRANATRVARYLPSAIPSAVREWVAGAVTAGRSEDVRLTLRGDLADFPFRRPEEGDFSVEARLRDATLRYAPGWPAIERFEGDLAFKRGGMRVGMRAGRVFEVGLSRTEAVLEDFRQPVLRIQGAGEGPAADLIRFVNQSPLATRIDDFTRDASALGPARLALKLDLPLADLDATKVAGSVEFLGNDLRLDTTLPPLSSVSGALEFTERALALRRISATLLGGPLRVEGETPEPGRFSLRAEGRIPAEGLRAASDNPLTRALKGEAAYRARIDVRGRASSVTLESDLRGLAAALPVPFEKSAEAAWPLRVVVSAPRSADPAARPTRDTIRVELRNDIRLAIERERDPRLGRLLIRRAALALDAEPALPDAGLAVQIRTPQIDIDAWNALLGANLREGAQPAAEGFAEGFSLLPTRFSVSAGRLRVAGKDLNDVSFNATRAGELWRASIGSREITGTFSWREALPGQRTGTLTARFTRLEIPRSRAGEVESILDTPQAELPALDIAADEFVLFDRKLGSLSLKATNSPGAGRPVWSLDALQIAHPQGRLSARGEWAPLAGSGARATRLDFDLEILEAGSLLEIYGLKEAMRGAPGNLTGKLSWRGSPFALDHPSLDGQINVKLGRGQFLRTDPGIAKLIGVLNLQSIPRRLTLDFRDIFAGGFSFDEIGGNVMIQRGIARTDDLVMRGVQARVRIRGSADIAAETQALEVEVRPELNAGLASIAYGAMVNPLIGLGSFVAQAVLSNPIRQMFTYEFEVSGSWADPQVVERRRIPGTTPAPASGAP